MAWNIKSWFPKFNYTRLKNGSHWYEYAKGGSQWSDLTGKTNLEIAQNHALLTPALLFLSQLFSQADFKIYNTSTGKYRDSHWLLDLLDNPDQYQIISDFLESEMFIQVAQGRAIVYAKKRIGFNDVEAFYLLNSDLIEWPPGYNSEMLNRTQDNKIDDVEITYDSAGEDKKIKVSDLLFFYDLPNMTYQTNADANFFGKSYLASRRRIRSN